ncbi:Patatin-like phospholipase [Lachnospiraceae bacterium NK3A20]|nr:Patatin-like phospholipase [Lachnospiraceae bacterium NK3A20]
MDLRGKTAGLVLSGGGAKGAYQQGMLEALEKAGLAREHTQLAGTSIGAMVAIMYACCGTEGVGRLMSTFGKAAAAVTGSGNWREMAAAGHKPMDNGLMFSAFRKLLPDEVLEKNNIPVTVCAYCLETKRPEYFRLDGLPASEQRALVIASGSLPGILVPVEYHGRHYLDGGVVPPWIDDGLPGDKIPLAVMAEGERRPVIQNDRAGNTDAGRKKPDVIIVSYLNPIDREKSVDSSLVSGGAQLLESRPSVPLEDKPGSGTLDFRPAILAAHLRLGYDETWALLQNVEETV